MRKPENIQIEEYNYHLPEDRIAKYPLPQRDASKLLIYKDDKINEKRFSDSIDILATDYSLYFNRTKVVQARLHFLKETGAKIEIFCLEPYSPSDYQMAFSSSGPIDMICLVGNAKKWKDGILKKEVSGSFGTTLLEAKKISRQGNDFIIQFYWDNLTASFAEILEAAGSTPIPPYLKRDAEKNDVWTYQTVYAEKDGSVAAPTAGLHFTDEVLEKVRKKGISTNYLTLHVGAGTFIPVKEENAVNHQMHAEMVQVDREMLETMLDENKKRIAVGTTSTRSLESLYWLGVQAAGTKDFSFTNLSLDQWDAYKLDDRLSLQDAISALLDKMDRCGINDFSFHTRIMITPGYTFKVINGLFTNFHQPQSTLLLLISAVVGDDWKRIYNYALENDFRFLSYGDSSLLWVR